ncbi:MAG: hypothetical protein R8M46_01920 [Ghiorsea sp.]
MSFKITMITLIVSGLLTLIWYVGAMPESLVPITFILVFSTLLHLFSIGLVIVVEKISALFSKK